MSLISPISNPLAAPAAPFPRGGAQAASDFTGALGTARELEEAGQDRARTAASQLVATALLQPILEGLRSGPFRSERFHGGRAEEAFGQQLHTVLAERIASAPGFGPTQAVAAQLSGGTPAGEPGGPGRGVNILG